jgi:hypothetical protein
VLVSLNKNKLQSLIVSFSICRMSSIRKHVKDQRRRPEGGGEWESIKILMQEPVYVPSLNPKAKTLQESDEHTNQQHRNDPLTVMNTTKKEYD